MGDPRVAAALLMAMALAGCSGGGSTQTETGTGTADPHAQHLGPLSAAPAWEVGMWWNYTSEALGSAYTLVVAGEAAEDWTIRTDNPGLAFYDQRFDVSNMGEVRKSDLAGSQQETRVEFMRFPITHGLNWTTTWDGQPVDIVAHVMDNGKAHFRASNATGVYASYVYDPAKLWFTEITFYDADGTEQFKSVLGSSGKGYAGDVVSWDLDKVLDKAGAVEDAGTQGVFGVPGTATDVWLSLTISCTSGAAQMGVVPAAWVPPAGLLPGGRGGGTAGEPCPLEFSFTGPVGAPQPPQGQPDEKWVYGAVGSPGSTGTYDMEVLIRTLQRTPFGA